MNARAGPSCQASIRRWCAVGSNRRAHSTIGGDRDQARARPTRGDTARATTGSHCQTRAISSTSTRLGFSRSTSCATSRSDIEARRPVAERRRVARVEEPLRHRQRFQLGDPEGEPVGRREEVVEVHGEPVRALDERAVQIELEAPDPQHHLLAEAIVEPRAQLGLRPLAVERGRQHLGGTRQQRSGHEQVDVAEDAFARVVVDRVRQRDALQHARRDAGVIERRGCLQQQPLDPQRVREPRAVQLLESRFLLRRQRPERRHGSPWPSARAGGAARTRRAADRSRRRSGPRVDRMVRGESVRRDRRRGDRHRFGRARGVSVFC